MRSKIDFFPNAAYHKDGQMSTNALRMLYLREDTTAALICIVGTHIVHLVRHTDEQKQELFDAAGMRLIPYNDNIFMIPSRIVPYPVYVRDQNVVYSTCPNVVSIEGVCTSSGAVAVRESSFPPEKLDELDLAGITGMYNKK